MEIYPETITNEPKLKKFKSMDNSEEDTTNFTTQCSDSKSSERNEDQEIFSFPPDTNISNMLDDIDFKDVFPSVTDRYFTPYYKLNITKPGDNICIWIHSNRLCMISLAPSHNIFQSEKITGVNFKVTEKLDRTTNKVSGKGKHGAQPLQENSTICTITTDDKETHVIKCGMIGKLVEVNKSLMENPELLRKPPHGGGYLAIILLNIKVLDSMKLSLLNKEDYETALKNQKEDFCENLS